MSNKLLYIVTQSDSGGAQKYVYDLATSSQAQNYDLTVAYGIDGDKVLAQQLESKNIPQIEIKNLVRAICPLKDIQAVFELKKLYSSLEPNVIHLNSTKAGVVGSLAYSLMNKEYKQKTKLIYTCHGWVFNESLSFLKKKLFTYLEKVTAKPKDKILCVSDYDRRIGLDYQIAKPDTLVTVHNGIDTNQSFLSKQQAREALNLPQDTCIIGSIGNFYANKGFTYLIEAASRLDNCLLVIIGDGSLRPDLEDQIRKNKLQDKVRLLGKKERASQYLKAFDIYICSSIKEGLSYTLLEASLAGLPIIATQVGGNPEIVINQKTGIIIPVKDTQAMVNSIQLLKDNLELRHTLGKQARQHVLDHFSLSAMIEKTFQHY